MAARDGKVHATKNTWMFETFPDTGAQPIDVLTSMEARALLKDDESELKEDVIGKTYKELSAIQLCGLYKMCCVYACCLLLYKETDSGGWYEFKKKYLNYMMKYREEQEPYKTYIDFMKSTKW